MLRRRAVLASGVVSNVSGLQRRPPRTRELRFADQQRLSIPEDIRQDRVVVSDSRFRLRFA